MLKNEFDKAISNLINLGQTEQAISSTKDFIAHASSALSGIYFNRLDDIEKATEVLLAIIDFTDDPYIYSNLAFLFSTKGEYEKALEFTEKGAKLPNPPADLYYNQGMAFKNLAKLHLSAESFRTALSLDPNSALIHWQLSDVLLAQGQFSEGLKEDQWRFEAIQRTKQFRARYNKPDWSFGDGSKKILVFNEGGFGDVIQFSGYLSALKELTNAHIIFEVAPQLYSLYVNSPAVDELIEFDENDVPSVEYDCVVSINSLPHFIDPNLEFMLPFKVPYVFPQKNDNAALGLIRNCDKTKIGIIWAGRHHNGTDHYRSFPLRYFEPLSELSHVQLFSLQKGPMIRTWPKEKTSSIFDGDENIEVVDLIEGSKVNFIDLSPHLNDFNDAANIIQELDLLVTVDTAAIHLAGALGAPAVLLLPHTHDWRWQKQWYPTVSILHQSPTGGWKSVIEKTLQFLQQSKHEPHFEHLSSISP